MRYVPFGIKLAHEAPLHIFPLSLIFVGLLSVDIFLNAPIDIQEIAVPVLNNYLQNNLELVTRLNNGLVLIPIEHHLFPKCH
jgi:hypothetical protein